MRKKEIFFGKTDRKVFKSIGIVEAVGSDRYNNKTYFEIVFINKKNDLDYLFIAFNRYTL